MLCWPREFKPDEGCAATANVVWLVIPSGIGVAQAVAHQRTAARIAGSGTVGPPVLAKHGVLDKVEQGGFAGAERSRDESMFRQVQHLTKAVPVNSQNATEGNVLPAHDCASFSASAAVSPSEGTACWNKAAA